MLRYYILVVMSASIYSTLIVANIGSSASHVYYMHSSKNSTTSSTVDEHTLDKTEEPQSDINNDKKLPIVLPEDLSADYMNNTSESAENTSFKRTIYYIVCWAPIITITFYCAMKR